MSFKLKKGMEAFQVTDGSFAGKRYEVGIEYEQIPPGEEKKFMKTKLPSSRKKEKK